MLQNVGIWGGGLFLAGTWFLQKLVLVDNLFTAWALTENTFPALTRHGNIFIFKSSACYL